MQKYEIMAIISNSVGPAKAAELTKEIVDKKIQAHNGKITFSDFWGERGFAYKINGETWGFYYVAQFEIEGSEIANLKNELNIEKQLVRFLITKVPENAPNPKTYEEMKAIEAKKVKVETAKVKKNEEKTVEKQKDETEDSTKQTEKKPTAISKPKKDAVDKKLDEILEDSSLDL